MKITDSNNRFNPILNWTDKIDYDEYLEGVSEKFKEFMFFSGRLAFVGQ
ncbi:hypothetical protein [Viridibacillus arvi]